MMAPLTVNSLELDSVYGICSIHMHVIWPAALTYSHASSDKYLVAMPTVGTLQVNNMHTRHSNRIDSTIHYLFINKYIIVQNVDKKIKYCGLCGM